MAPFGQIYSYPHNFRVNRALVVAGINRLDVQVAADFRMGETNKSPEFLAKFPMGKVPALECADGFCIAEGAAICEYLAASGPAAEQLLGAAGDAKTRGRIAEWAFLSENELVVNMMPVAVMTFFKKAPYDEKVFSLRAGNFKRALQRIEVALKGGKQYLVGEQLTLADIMVFGALAFGLGSVFDAEMRETVPETVRYIQALAKLPEFKPFGVPGIFEA
ncbi:glutathione S-transferase [Thozetella sp. PMI_491]|nr:glutathione S-transferase [Thozetella sp. PMI_491]